MSRRRAALFDSFLIAALTVLLIRPLFGLEYLDIWSSIESTFIADGRMLAAHLPHPGWQPLWYCGTRFDYIYPPALRYGTALLSLAGGISTARAYHLYTAFFYVFGIVAIYWLVRTGSRSRGTALLSSAATALLSPSFLFLSAIRKDSGWRVPQRLHALMSYGEGPHVSALCVMTAALAVSWIALRRWNASALGGAAALCAFSVANNFYGATALAVFFPLMAWSVWIGERDWRVWLRAASIAALAWGLCAFWLNAAYLRITLVNLHWVSQPGNNWSLGLAAAVAFIYCALSWKAAAGRPEREWTVFVSGAALFLSLIVLGLDYWGFRVAGDSYRLIPEMDMAMILFSAEMLRLLWRRPRWRFAVVAAAVMAFSPAWLYLRHAWTPFPRAASPPSSYEYRIAQWVNANLPGERVLPAGSVRFWFDAWSDNAQPDGGSMQGMLNQILPAATWQILHGTGAELSTLWLQALGTDAIIVGGPTSFDAYHDYEHPERFAGALPVLYDDGHATAIYAIPRIRRDIVRVVDDTAIRAVGPVRGGDDRERLTQYVAAVEDPSQPPATVSWHDFDHAEIHAAVGPGQTLLFQETYDPDWRAYENGRQLGITPEASMGFMLIPLPPGNHTVEMRFEQIRSDRLGRIVSVLSGMMLIVLLAPRRRKRKAAPPRVSPGEIEP